MDWKAVVKGFGKVKATRAAVKRARGVVRKARGKARRSRRGWGW